MRTACATLIVAAAALSWCCAAGAPPAPRSERGPAGAWGRLAAVKPGMTAAQVEEAVGRPAQIDEGGPAGTQVWYYEDGFVILERDRVSFCLPARGRGT